MLLLQYRLPICLIKSRVGNSGGVWLPLIDDAQSNSETAETILIILFILFYLFGTIINYILIVLFF